MDKAIEQIFQAFNHIARELQVYFISGFLIILNVLLIDHFYYNSSLWQLFIDKKVILSMIIVAYFFGHICMAFYYVVLEMPKFDKKLCKFFGISYKTETVLLPKIYEKDKDTYRHFVERYIILFMMRWTMSAALFIGFLANTTYIIFVKYKSQFFIITILFFFASISLFILASKTESDCSNRIKSMQDDL